MKAKSINLLGEKVIPVANETFRKQEIDISDPTGALKMILLEERSEKSLANNVTCIFSKFKLKVRGRSRYLNSFKVQEVFSPKIL